MKKSLISLALLLLILPTAALAKGGHGGGHGGHGSHGGHGGHRGHTGHGTGSHGSKGSGSKGSSSKGSGSKGSSSKVSSSHNSSHSILNGGGHSRAAKSAARASAVGTPVHSWKSIANETTYQSSKTSNNSVPELYRGGSVTNQLLYYPMFRPHYHSHVQSDKDWNDEQDKADKSGLFALAKKVMFTVLAGIAVVGCISAFVFLAKEHLF